MRPALVLAAVAALLAANVAAQPNGNQQPPPPGEAKGEVGPPLSADHIIAPDGPAQGDSSDIDLVNEKATPALRVASAIGKPGMVVGTESRTLDNAAVVAKPSCKGKKGYEQQDFPLTITPGRPCRISVTLTGVTGPGHYVARMFLFGEDGGRKEVKLDFARRLHILWALLLVVLGVGTGIAVSSWQGGGRERTRKVIGIKKAIETLTDLDRHAGRPPRMMPVVARAREIEEALIRGDAADDAEIGEIRFRPSQYLFLLDIEARGASLPDDKRKQLARAIDDVVDQMLPLADGKLGAIPQAAFKAVRDKLRELQAPVQISEASEWNPGDDLPLWVTPEMTSGEAQASYRNRERIVVLVLVAVFVALALGTLYVNNIYWGSYTDLLAAFMIGFGAFAGAVASVDTFLRRARTAPS